MELTQQVQPAMHTGNKQTGGAMDIFRMVAAFMVVAIHTSPLISLSGMADFVFVRVICRLAVPFFFMSSGYFLLRKLGSASTKKQVVRAAGGFSIKLLKLYAISMLVYLPLNVYLNYFKQSNLLLHIVPDILWNGTFYHLWYFPAALLGCWVAVVLMRLKPALGFAIAALLYAIGLGGDSYYGLVMHLPGLESFYNGLFVVFNYTRNGLFFAPLYFLLGMRLARHTKPARPLSFYITGFCLALAAMIAEGLLLLNLNAQRHDSMYIMLPLCSVMLFNALRLLPARPHKSFRKLSLLIYIVHPWFIALLYPVARVLRLTPILVENSLVFYVCVSLLSFVAAWVMLQAEILFTKQNSTMAKRASVQVNLSAIAHNLHAMQALLPKGCAVMGVVKTNAYGLGAVPVAKKLRKEGVSSFAVSTLQEGIELRRAGVGGEILVLGYTPPEDAKLLKLYRITQTVCDASHAAELNAQGIKLTVHIKIDTGMHRLGVPPQDIPALQQLYSLKNLRVTGTFTHLSTADSAREEDVAFANRQITLFFEAMEKLRALGVEPGKLHVQATHGVLNYPGLPCQYARIGIALYGTLSAEDDYARLKPDLQPVATIKAVVASVHHLQAGESVGYSRSYVCTAPQTIATLAIGYADGIPRNIQNGYVLLHGKKAPIVGRISMDQLAVCTDGIDNVQPGDYATLLGCDGEEEITPTHFAAWCGTISNEVLARLGNRLGKKYSG